MIFAALALMLFGDFFVGFGSVRGVKSDSNQATSTAGKFQQKNAEIEISEGEHWILAEEKWNKSQSWIT